MQKYKKRNSKNIKHKKIKKITMDNTSFQKLKNIVDSIHLTNNEILSRMSRQRLTTSPPPIKRSRPPSLPPPFSSSLRPGAPPSSYPPSSFPPSFSPPPSHPPPTTPSNSKNAHAQNSYNLPPSFLHIDLKVKTLEELLNRERILFDEKVEGMQEAFLKKEQEVSTLEELLQRKDLQIEDLKMQVSEKDALLRVKNSRLKELDFKMKEVLNPPRSPPFDQTTESKMIEYALYLEKQYQNLDEKYKKMIQVLEKEKEGRRGISNKIKMVRKMLDEIAEETKNINDEDK